MKAFRILGTTLSESFKGVFRNFSLSLASISCITITLILVGFSILLSYNVNNFTSEIEKDMTIVVFLDRKITEEEIDEVRSEMQNMDNIKSIEFNSKNQVKEVCKKSQMYLIVYYLNILMKLIHFKILS